MTTRVCGETVWKRHGSLTPAKNAGDSGFQKMLIAENADGSGSRRFSRRAFVPPEQLGGGQHMPVNGFLQAGFAGAGAGIEVHVQRVEPEIVTMRSRWRAGPSVAVFSRVVLALQRAVGQAVLIGNVLFKVMGHGGNVVDDPMGITTLD